MDPIVAYALGAAVALVARELAGLLFDRHEREEDVLPASKCRPPGRRRLLG